MDWFMDLEKCYYTSHVSGWKAIQQRHRHICHIKVFGTVHCFFLVGRTSILGGIISDIQEQWGVSQRVSFNGWGDWAQQAGGVCESIGKGGPEDLGVTTIKQTTLFSLLEGLNTMKMASGALICQDKLSSAQASSPLTEQVLRPWREVPQRQWEG